MSKEVDIDNGEAKERVAKEHYGAYKNDTHDTKWEEFCSKRDGDCDQNDSPTEDEIDGIVDSIDKDGMVNKIDGITDITEGVDANGEHDAHKCNCKTKSHKSTKIDKLLAEIEEYKSDHIRMVAKLHNMQDRSERSISEAHKYGCKSVVSDLLPVADSLSRALEIKYSGKESKKMHDGIKLTLDILYRILEKNGVRKIEPQEGDPFDPNLHDAVSTAKSEALKSNSVFSVLQIGYKLHDRVLRAAMVIVVD